MHEAAVLERISYLGDANALYGPLVEALVEARYLNRQEVELFYEENGRQANCRIDYLLELLAVGRHRALPLVL